MQIKPFRLSRRRLAAWYTGIIVLILGICGFIIYRLIVHAKWLSLEREMRNTALVVEKWLQPALIGTGKIDSTVQPISSVLCFEAQKCDRIPISDSVLITGFALLDQTEQDHYCVRLLDSENQPIAALKFPFTNPECQESQIWKTLVDKQGHYYHNKIYMIQNRSQGYWGNLQVVRTVTDLDIYLFWVEICLGLLILLSIGLGGAASWWLAGVAMQPVKHSYQQMQQFTADAAHELRTPLAALKAMAQAALRSNGLTPDEAKEALEVINRQSNHLSTILQDLLLLCHMDQQAITKTFAPCCLNTLLQELAGDFMAIATASEITLSTQIPDQPTLMVLGNRDQLYRVVANLLSNAIQYTLAGGTVTVMLSYGATHAVVQVYDTGVGIAPEDQPYIFDRFYRVDQKRTRSSGGSGLGLAIAQAIVQNHNSSLQVESQLGKGSLFKFRLALIHGGFHSGEV